jgi:hypothetical protein
MTSTFKPSLFSELNGSQLRDLQANLTNLVKQFGDTIRQSDPSSYQKLNNFLSQMATNIGVVSSVNNDPMLTLLIAQLGILKSENDNLLLEKTRLEERVLQSQTESTNYIFEEYQKLKKCYELLLSTPQHQSSDSIRLEHELLKEDYQVVLDKLSRYQTIPAAFRSSFSETPPNAVHGTHAILKPALNLPIQHQQPQQITQYLPKSNPPKSVPKKHAPPLFMF